MGKSTAIGVALSLFGMIVAVYHVASLFPCAWRQNLPSATVSIPRLGMPRSAIYEKVTNAFVLERASASSMPFAIINDPTKTPNKGCDLSDVIVELYNGGKYANVRSGTLYARSVLRQEER